MKELKWLFPSKLLSQKMADEFAIEFAEWLIKRETKYFESLKELLEIYKKTL